MGEAKVAPPRLDFERRLMLEFHGSAISSAGGLLPYHEPDHARELTELCQDRRHGRWPRSLATVAGHGRWPWSLYHLPTCRGGDPEKPVRQHPAPDRRRARLAPGLLSGSGSRSPNRPDQERNPTWRAGSPRQVWCERRSCYHRRQLAGAIWGLSAKSWRRSVCDGG